MSGVTALCLAGSVLCTWLGAAVLLRLTPLARIHAVSFVNVASGGAMTLAVWTSDGVSSRAGKVLMIWAVLVVTGALSAHVTGRAIHLRSGERR